METIETYNKVVLAGIDIQNDFLPGGSLPVPEGDLVVEPFNVAARWVRNQHNGLVTFTRDWHPEVTNHFSEEPNYETTWPVHCVAHTLGAQFAPKLEVLSTDVRLYKGTEVDEDAYSGFQAHSHDGQSLESLIAPIKHDQVAFIMGGLALDVCVGATGTDAVKFAHHLFDHDRLLDVYVLTDATKAITQKTGAMTLKVFERLGIKAITTNDLVSGRVMKVEEF